MVTTRRAPKRRPNCCSWRSVTPEYVGAARLTGPPRRGNLPFCSRIAFLAQLAEPGKPKDPRPLLTQRIGHTPDIRLHLTTNPEPFRRLACINWRVHIRSSRRDRENQGPNGELKLANPIWTRSTHLHTGPRHVKHLYREVLHTTANDQEPRTVRSHACILAVVHIRIYYRGRPHCVKPYVENACILVGVHVSKHSDARLSRTTYLDKIVSSVLHCLA